ncbi:MAG: hypothetical protein ACREIC_25405 [Limisphaerales bacterium]
MKLTLFTLSSARSGTLYLKHLFQNNIPDCVCRHEPFFDWGNPTLFGRAIYDAHAGRHDRVRSLLEKKRRYIERLPGRVYVESSHAFLKSAYVAALDVFPELRLIHLIRDPVAVARSEAYREDWRRRVHAPFHFYRGDDGRRHFVWALTGNEEIFRTFESERLTLFQWYLIEWIEIENRAISFLNRRQLHQRCYTLHVPSELNDARCVESMFRFFGLAPRQPQISFAGRKNRSLGYSRGVGPPEDDQCAAVLERLPPRHLDIFSH